LRARARRIVGRERAIGGTHKAMAHIFGVGVVSRDRPMIIESLRKCSLVGTLSRAGGIERCYAAIGGAQEAMAGICEST